MQIVGTYKDIIKHLENYGILFANQHGFRKNHSCETQLILTVEDLARNVDNGDQMDMLILDFSKAFDKVPHRRLLSKLQFYGIQGKTLAWIESWLTNRSQSVIEDGVCFNLGSSYVRRAARHSTWSTNVFIIH